MDLSRPSQQRRQRSRDTFDRRVDQWLETGRQFVDGVSGTRPGKRRIPSSDRRSTSNLESVGRWVGEKIDWFLEDEDDWQEPWQKQFKMNKPGNKRPLEAISRRVPQGMASSDSGQLDHYPEEEWPDESSFRVDRWQRPKSSEKVDSDRASESDNCSLRPDSRPLPRSSRRRF